MTQNVKIGDLVEFHTGMVCKVVPEGEAVLFVDSNKITDKDLEFYLESEACRILKDGKVYTTQDELNKRMSFLVATHVMNYAWRSDIGNGWSFQKDRGELILCSEYNLLENEEQFEEMFYKLLSDNTYLWKKKINPDGTYGFSLYTDTSKESVASATSTTFSRAVCFAALKLKGIHLQVIAEKTSGLCSGGGCCASFLNYDPDYQGINWSLVSEEFKQEFLSAWKNAYEFDCEPNWYGVLDELGWMINHGYFTKRSVFDQAYKLAANIQLEKVS